MTNRAGFSPIVCVLAVLLAPVLGRAAEEPAATAAIPPPAPPATHKPAPPPAKASAVSHARQRHATAAKKNARRAVRTATRAAGERKPGQVAERHARHRTLTHRSVVVRPAPPPANLPRDYAGVPVPGPNGPPPPFPPPWYDRARPAIAYAYPPFMGPRGPMPWWLR